MSTQALSSEAVGTDRRNVLLNQAGLYGTLRTRGERNQAVVSNRTHRRPHAPAIEAPQPRRRQSLGPRPWAREKTV